MTNHGATELANDKNSGFYTSGTRTRTESKHYYKGEDYRKHTHNTVQRSEKQKTNSEEDTHK